MQLTNTNILITGGAGFIGSNLVDYFLENGNSVTVLDNLLTGKENNIRHHFNNRHFKFIKGDIRDLSTCREAVKKIDIVFHQAALGSVPRSVNDPLTTNDINVNGFLNMLLAARDENVKRFIYAASSSAYGDSTELPKIEEHIGKPMSPYAVSKYTNELYAMVFANLYQMEIIGLRYFNVFGQRQDPNGAYAAAIPLFIKQLIEGIAPRINGDGSATRDFTYVKNVIKANELAALAKNKSALNQVYNIACGQNINLNQLINILKEKLSRYDSSVLSIQPVYGPERAGDIHDSLASIEKAKQWLNYHPAYSISQGLDEAIEWYWQYFKQNK